MPVTCSNCGNTNHPSGARNCRVCGAVLPAQGAQFPQKAAVPAASFPMLVTSQGRRYRLSDNVDTLIGNRGCAIILADPGVASRHARIFPSGGGFTIEDLGGGTRVNGRSINAPVALQPGDSVQFGQATLVYQGPPSTAGTPQPQPVAQPAKPVAAYPAVFPAMQPPQPQRPGVPLKVWGKNPPVTEGEVMLVDGPHMMDKGNMGARLAAGAALGLLTKGMLAFLPLMGQRAIPTWFLRVKDSHTGQDVSVLMAGQPSSLPQMGDVLAIWGKVKEGNVLLERAYSYATDSEIRVKR